jgi:hypothetical protein
MYRFFSGFCQANAPVENTAAIRAADSIATGLLTLSYRIATSLDVLFPTGADTSDPLLTQAARSCDANKTTGRA